MQTNNANLAGCFVHVCHIGVVIKKISFENNSELKNYCYKVYNKQFADFGEYNGYLLAFFLHPMYHGKCFIIN